MKNEKICIICINVAFGNAAALQNVLDCDIVIEKQEPKGYGTHLTKQPIGINNIPKADHYIFVGSGIMTRIDTYSLKGRKTVLITDSHYLRETDLINSIIEEQGIEVFCMADLWDFCKFPKKMYVHPFVAIDLPAKKHSVLTISHSPFSENKKILKGTAGIELALGSIDVNHNYDCIVNSSWEDSLLRKSTSHLFIDQLCVNTHLDERKYKGGIGKSGLEAMLLKCLTISSGHPFDSDIPKPPYVTANTVKELTEKLTLYSKNKELRERVVSNQYEWAKKYTDPKLVAQRIIKY
jgi:hypothetical protein